MLLKLLIAVYSPEEDRDSNEFYYESRIVEAEEFINKYKFNSL